MSFRKNIIYQIGFVLLPNDAYVYNSNVSLLGSFKHCLWVHWYFSSVTHTQETLEKLITFS